MGVINVQGFFVLVNKGQEFAVWEERSLRPVVLIFYPSHRGLKQKNNFGLVSGNGSIRSWRNPWKRLNKQGPKVSRRMIKMKGPRRGETQAPSSNLPTVTARGCFISRGFVRLDL